MSEIFDKGDKPTISAKFRDKNGVFYDPAAVFCQIKKPDATTTTYEFGVNAELIKDAVGKYHVEVDLNQVGEWFYRFYSTGAGQTAGEGSLTVKSNF